jgi:hypothetical protein
MESSRALIGVQPAVAQSLRIWHEMVAARDPARLASIAHPDVVFRSPVAHSAYHSAAALCLAIETVLQVFEDFRYQREFVSGDGFSVALEFSAKVGERALEGVDLIRFDESGRIVEFEVMVRPLNALQALAEAMGARLGARLPAFRQQR